MRSSLQIQRSVLLDDGKSRAHYLTPGRTCCERFFQNYSHSVFRLFSVTEYNFTISITQFALFRSLQAVLVLYKLIIRVLCFNAHVTCIHSNTCGRFDMIEPLDKMLPDFKSPARDVPSSSRLNVEFADLIATCNIIILFDTEHLIGAFQICIFV